MQITLKANNGFEIVIDKDGKVILRSQGLDLVFPSLEDFLIWTKEAYSKV